MMTLIRRLAGKGLTLTENLAFLAPLATRLVLGLGFIHTGLGKWQNYPRTVDFFTSLGIPFPAANAAFIATLELVGGVMLILGLMTRLFAGGLAATMVVALATAERHNFLASWGAASEQSPTDIAAFAFLLFLLWLVLLGPGKLALDSIVAHKCDFKPQSV